MSLLFKGRTQKLAYSFGSIGDTGFYQVIAAFLLFFLVEIIYLDPWLAGLAYALAFGVWNAINDPMIGVLSDRTRTRFGRRRPWIAIGAPLAFVCTILLWVPPFGILTNSWNIPTFLYYLLILAAWAWSFSMCAVTWFAAYPEMWETVKDRTEVVIYRQIFAVVGGALAIAAFPVLVVAFSAVPLGITTTSLSEGTVNEAYFENLQATSGTEPYTWENIGSLPDGLSLDNTGKITGIPATEGTYEFTVKVTDAKLNTDTKTLSIEIKESGIFEVVTTGLPNAQAGEDYSATLEATGGTSPYTWKIIDGCLPYGTSLDTEGTISGIPTDAADFTFTVKATDNTGNTDNRELSIKVISEYAGGTLGGWAWAGGIVGALFAGTYLFSLTGIRERKELWKGKPWGIAESLKITFSNKTLRAYVGIDLMTWCMTGWLSAMTPFFIVHSLGLGLADFALVMAPNMLGMFAFFAIWRAIYMRVGPKVTLAAAMIGITLVFVPVLFVQTLLQAAIWAFFVGCMMAGMVLAREVMMGDVVDEDELKTGTRREGSYFGTFMAMEKLSFVIIGLGAALVLTTIIGYVAGQPKPEFMNMGIRLGMLGFTAIFTAISLVFLALYPLGKGRVVEIQKKIKKLHVEKKKKLKESTAKAKKRRTAKVRRISSRPK